MELLELRESAGGSGSENLFCVPLLILNSMGKETKIAWTDSTLNFWSGCAKISVGCLNCYAELRDRRHMIEPENHWGKDLKFQTSKNKK
jgi:hypothetical protein